MANLKFFYKNKLNSATTYAFTSADETLASYLYDNQINPKLISSGSNDTTDEIYEFTFGTAVDVNAIILQNHNFKSYTIQYDASGYTDFSTPINVTGNAVSANYHEFTSVSTTKIKIMAKTTQVANAQKFIGDVNILQTFGASASDGLTKNPVKSTIEYQENSKSLYTSGRENLFVLFGAGMKIKLNFEALTEADMTYIYNLKYAGVPVYIYLNGGSDTAKTDRGWRVGDLYSVNLTDDWKPKIRGDILGIGTDIDLTFEATHQVI